MAIGFKTGKAALALNPKPGFGFTSAANPEMLPKPKPRAVPEHFVVPPIRSRKVACAQQSRVWNREDALQPLVSVPEILTPLIPEILARLRTTKSVRKLPVLRLCRERREEDVGNAKTTRSRDFTEGRSCED